MLNCRHCEKELPVEHEKLVHVSYPNVPSHIIEKNKVAGQILETNYFFCCSLCHNAWMLDNLITTIIPVIYPHLITWQSTIQILHDELLKKEI